MPVVVVTEGDVAAVPYNGGQYSFRLDTDNKGPFAAILPLSQLLDPAKEAESIESLHRQFALVPYGIMRDSFLKASAPAYLTNSLLKAGQTAAHLKAVELLLDDYLKSPASFEKSAVPGMQEAAAQLRLHALPSSYEVQPKTGSEAIDARAEKFGNPRNVAASIISTAVSFDKDGTNIIRSYMQRPEAVAAKMDAQHKAAQVILPRFADRVTDTATLTTARTPDELQTAVKSIVRTELGQMNDAEKSAFCDALISYSEKHQVTTGPTDINFSFRLGPREVRLTLDDIKNVTALHRSPATSAQTHYTGMKAEALEQEIKPDFLVSAEHKAATARALDSCEPWLADCAQAKNLKVIIVKDKTNIASLIPNTTEMQLGNTTHYGRSTGNGVYAKAALLKTPALLREEIQHEIERGIAPTKEGLVPFSLQPEFTNAIQLDVAQGLSKPAYRKLVGDLPQYLTTQFSGSPKVNLTLNPSLKNLPHLSRTANLDAAMIKNYELYAEALPDIYHMAAMVDETLANRGRVQVGGIGGFGGVKYTTRDETMQAALPNSWPLLQGAAPGKKLVQQANGTVEEIDAKLNAPSGAKVVTSLKERCESATAEAERAISASDTSKQSLVASDVLGDVNRLTSGGMHVNDLLSAASPKKPDAPSQNAR